MRCFASGSKSVRQTGFALSSAIGDSVLDLFDRAWTAGRTPAAASAPAESRASLLVTGMASPFTTHYGAHYRRTN